MARLSTPRTAWFVKKALTAYAYLFPRHWFKPERRRYPQTMFLLPGYTFSFSLIPHGLLRRLLHTEEGEGGVIQSHYRWGLEGPMGIYYRIVGPHYLPGFGRFYHWLCKCLTGHEISQTENGYAGGRWVDKWCRWCNENLKIPIEESTWAEDNADLLDAVGKEYTPPDE